MSLPAKLNFTRARIRKKKINVSAEKKLHLRRKVVSHFLDEKNVLGGIEC